MIQKIVNGDCLDIMRKMNASSVDSIVTDPPYGLSFMGKNWDHGVPGVPFWVEALRVLKPGGHLLAFGGSRTYHRLASAIEDAGFEIRDQIMWLYGSGFPKSLDVSKAIDKAAGAEREVVGTRTDGRGASPSKMANHGPGDTGIGHADGSKQVYVETAPATDAARQWSGWGTALKPAHEPVVVARKPLIGTVAENVLAHGTGAMNIDGCRVDIDPAVDDPRLGGKGDWSSDKMAKNVYEGGYAGVRVGSSPLGRWPANVIHDGDEEVTEKFPNGEARFFYCAKAGKTDRGEGNTHPTVKPTDLMRYLCRLVTPPGGVVLDPFAGSGSTGVAAGLEGFHFVGIEKEEKYCGIAEARLEHRSLTHVQ